MSEKTIRVRFAPSPTGGLHLGGVRTALYNYLYARKHEGKFILRIEDTDQTRFVPGAEQYIMDCLRWCGLEPDESPEKGGDYGPYRQSERKPMYRKYAEDLVKKGFAYYAFDTPEELDQMRISFKTEQNPSPQYDQHIRDKMRNSLSLPADETDALLKSNAAHVIRIKMPANETVEFNDLIRGEVSFNTSTVDDKVLLKADGMPTYHLAVVVDDYLMKITQVFRGEEWLPSAPVHIMLWKYLGLEKDMPEWAHLPLILKPDGHGKLSKRDGDRLGFPVYAMDWTDPKTGELTSGFRELGFLDEAFINMLAMLGWNDGTGKELFSLDELCETFSLSRVHKGGAKFDFEKAKWYNHEWIKRSSADDLLDKVKSVFEVKGVTVPDDQLLMMITLVKDRCTLISDFWEQGSFFFKAPASWDLPAIQSKWNADKKVFFESFSDSLSMISDWSFPVIEQEFKTLAASKNIKAGELQLPLRVMLVGGKFGPPVFEIAEKIGRVEMISRIRKTLEMLG
ncbi:glutamate--tRNA ligase [Pollutibacter soli]|uniref:glutamate--tRNA ligase n=1 Tax=Pollutibacter soli TaxID=3034157 RepID=UPI003013BA9F